MGHVFTCAACGWTVVTPHGGDDLVEAVTWHGKKIHGMGMPREEILKGAKAV